MFITLSFLSLSLFYLPNSQSVCRDKWYLGGWDRKIIGSNGVVEQGSMKIGVTQIERSHEDSRQTDLKVSA